MSLPLLVRTMQAGEIPMVLANWKANIRLQDKNDRRTWGRGLTPSEFWTLVDYAMTRITLPSSVVFVGCHESEPDTPLCWAAVRENRMLHIYARESVRSDPEFAAEMERAFVNSIEERVGRVERAGYNPFEELQR